MPAAILRVRVERGWIGCGLQLITIEKCTWSACSCMCVCVCVCVSVCVCARARMRVRVRPPRSTCECGCYKCAGGRLRLLHLWKVLQSTEHANELTPVMATRCPPRCRLVTRTPCLVYHITIGQRVNCPFDLQILQINFRRSGVLQPDGHDRSSFAIGDHPAASHCLHFRLRSSHRPPGPASEHSAPPYVHAHWGGDNERTIDAC